MKRADKAAMANPHPTLDRQVVEALAKDSGQGLARIDPADMEYLGVTVGDIIEVRGQRRAAARAMPNCLGERGQGLVQLDAVLRENAVVRLNGQVRLSRAEAQPASSLELRPLRELRSPAQDRLAHLPRLLHGVPFLPGDRVRVTLEGGDPVDFIVVRTFPTGTVVVAARDTVIRVKEGPVPPKSYNYQ